MKNQRFRKFLLLFVAATFLFVACKKSVEGEKKSFESNKSRVNQLMSDYPAFKPALQEQLKKAEDVMASAEGTSNEDQKIDKMSEANGLLTAKFITSLDGIRKKIDKLKEEKIDLSGQKMDMNDKSSAKLAIQEADRTIYKVENILKSGANNVSRAESVMKQAMDAIATAQKLMDKVTKNAKDKQDTKDKKVSEDNKKKEEAAKPWKCSYCGSKNDANAKECSSCGAAKE